MPGSSNTSFIPKHTPNKAERKGSPRQMFLGTLLVRVLFFAVLIAAVGTFFYERSLRSQLDSEMFKFTTAASSYDSDAEKLATVVSMDNRLKQAAEIFAYNVSTLAIFEALEGATIASAQFTSVDVTREKPEEIIVVANVRTNTFDSTLFQRSIFSDTDILAETELADVTIEGTSSEGEENETNIVFKATMTINPEDIPALLTRDATFVPVDTGESREALNVPTSASATEPVELEVGFSNEEAS